MTSSQAAPVRRRSPRFGFPYYDVGYRAVETLLAVLEGEAVPDTITIPSRLMVRRSYGCLDATVTQAALRQFQHSSDGFAATFAGAREDLLNNMRREIKSPTPERT